MSLLGCPRERFGLIVVDDGSRVRHNAVPAIWHDGSISRDSPEGTPIKRSRALPAQASGRYLVFNDDDCLPNVNWLNALADVLGCAAGCAIESKTTNALDTNLCARVSNQLNLLL
jgi:hypothetical protein